MKNVWVLGANGMLGTQVSKQLANFQIKTSNITRNSLGKHVFGLSRLQDFETIRHLEENFGVPTHIVNAIGVVKPRIDESNGDSVLNAIQINSVLPRNLTAFCEARQVHLIQIATDCVFSGNKGCYVESDLHDPTDIYGKTKSLGELTSDNLSLIRCSIIGREVENKYSLVEWVNSQKPNAVINGFVNHNWNGVTTKVFGNIVAGIVLREINPLGRFHLIPQDKVSKYELVKLIAEKLARQDLDVCEFQSEQIIDRTLSTEMIELNELVWKYAGFDTAPTILEMINLGL